MHCECLPSEFNPNVNQSNIIFYKWYFRYLPKAQYPNSFCLIILDYICFKSFKVKKKLTGIKHEHTNLCTYTIHYTYAGCDKYT